MKLTTKLIKKLIAEEMEQMPIPFSAEKKPTDPAHHDPEKKPTDSIESADALRRAVRALTQSQENFEGISSAEAGLIYELLEDIVAIAKDDNATRVLQKLERLLGQGSKK